MILPMLMRLEFPAGQTRRLAVWLPIGLLWVVVLLLATLLSPLLLLIALPLLCHRPSRQWMRFAWLTCLLLTATRGLRVQAGETRGAGVGIDLY